MTTRLKFLYVCEETFAGLPGDDAQRRRCDRCATTVHNLDAMDGEQQMEVLRQATRERTTVCVSLAVPSELAQACREGERAVPVEPSVEPPGFPREEVERLAGRVAVVPTAPVEPERRLEVLGESRGFVAELPAVTGAIGELAGELGLSERTGSGEARWGLHHHAPAVSGVVVVAVEGGRTIVTSTLTAYEAAEGDEPDPVGRLYMLVPLVWCVCGGVALFAGAIGAYVGLGLTGAYGLAFAASRALAGWRRRAPVRAALAWGRDWQRRFWATLAERLARRQPYRSPGG